MATKTKTHPLNGAHTAGIFSDMTVDGPEIGTLVVVVDRGKNLPNRKTIGKQDPYCAARLGKEAKKTTTDIRGGQTPKWDQELRFTVHDSPDYYQLKVSCFNDDKKTELIGEAWIDLRDIIVPGGGQNDVWHQLNCKGKYAGEVRIEITYYDSRPKPDRPAARPRQNGDADEVPGQQRAMPKRRPLPSDPVTGKAPAQPSADAAQTPPRSHSNPPTSYVPNQSPLQQVEYGTNLPNPSRHPGPERFTPGASPHTAMPTSQQHRAIERHDKYAVTNDDRDSGFGFLDQPYDQDYDEPDPRAPYDGSHEAFDLPSLDDDRPPPPPVHRSRNNSGGFMAEPSYRPGYDMSSAKPLPPNMRQDVLTSQAHRHSVPATTLPAVPAAYPGKPVYRPHNSDTAVPHGQQYTDSPSPPRHYSYDSSYGADPAYRSMQPTVEDVPESPSPLTNETNFRRSRNRMPQYDQDFDPAASPEPLNIGGRGSSASGGYSSQHRASMDQEPSMSFSSSRGYNNPATSSQTSYTSQQTSGYRSEADGSSYSNDFAMVPASLYPGVDPSPVHDLVRARMNDDRHHQRRNTQPAMATPPRGRQMDSMSSQYYNPDSSPTSYSTPPQQPYNRSPITYSGGPPSPNVLRPRAISPNPAPSAQHTIKRKSVSPAPAAEGHRLSGIPFGPDSYDALNPNLLPTKAPMHPDFNETSGKIITHDGREVDPSDHLPQETWAPEPEPKPPKLVSAPWPSPAGGQPMPPSSGRRPLRIQGRPQSIQTPPSYALPDMNEPATSSPPVSNGRNRLQKKANRASAMPAMSSSPVAPRSGSGSAAGSPLAPLGQYQENSGFTPPRSIPRAHTFDYPNENHSPLAMTKYGSSPRGGGFDQPPPRPAKIPLALPPVPGMGGGGGRGDHDMTMSGALPPSHGARGGDPYGYAAGSSGAHEWSGLSLEEEMRQIDIGNGRARRHRGAY